MADSLSLKWIDGNSDPTGETAPENPAFNVDDPTMWTPLSVISGLASGFCERKAQLDPVAGEHFVWGSEDTNSNTVSRCVNNLTAGSEGIALFGPASNNYFCPIGSASTITGTASNYMTAMDAAITTLISPESGVRYVNKNGNPYTFGTLATEAMTNAAHADSAIEGEITKGGGSDYCAPLAKALPVEWAIQRKWMLESLKYIGGSMQAEAPYIKQTGLYIEQTTVDPVTGTLYGIPYYDDISVDNLSSPTEYERNEEANQGTGD